MKKCLTILAMIFGFFSVMISSTSCNKEECCEWTDDFGDSYKYCEDDNFPQGYTWNYIQAASAYYNGKCD